jgi:hypothetical protein
MPHAAHDALMHKATHLLLRPPLRLPLQRRRARAAPVSAQARPSVSPPLCRVAAAAAHVSCVRVAQKKSSVSAAAIGCLTLPPSPPTALAQPPTPPPQPPFLPYF